MTTISGIAFASFGLALALAAKGAAWPGDSFWLEAQAAWGLFSLVHACIAGVLLVTAVALAGFAAEALIAVELAHKAILAAALGGPLALAQAADPGQQPGAPAGGAASRQARAEVQIGVYGGGNIILPADVLLRQPGGTDMLLRNVRWRSEALEDPFYYGVRVTWWPAAMPSLGIMLDFTHTKAVARLGETVAQKGMRDGVEVPAREPASATFRRLEYTHGLNFVTVNAIYRLRGLHARRVPYFGAGAGVVYPHVEVARQGQERKDWTYAYQVGGVGL